MKGEHFREIDVMKGVLILPVVVGHLLPQVDPCMESNLGRRIPLAIYGFHMQAIVFVAGFCPARLAENLSRFVVRGKWLSLLLLGRMPRKDVCK